MTRQWSRLEALANGQLTSLELSIDDVAFELPPNASIHYPAVATLARAIAETDIRTPVEVYFKIGDPTPYACDGFELRAAVDFARAKQWIADNQPVMVIAKLENNRDEATDKLFARLLKSGKKSLTPLERADCIRELVNLNHQAGEIAKQLQTTKQYILRLLSLSEATPAIRQLIDERRLKATTVMNTNVRYGAIKSEQLLVEAVKEAEGKGKKATGKFVESFISRQSILDEADIPTGKVTSNPPSTSTSLAAPLPVEQLAPPTGSEGQEVGAQDSPDSSRHVLIEKLENTDFSKLPLNALSKLVNTLNQVQILAQSEGMEQ